jgi:hypothetical protein
MILALCQWIQATRSSAALSESTWAYPIIGAIHVLGIAWFGGAVLMMNVRPFSKPLFEGPDQLVRWRRIGIAAMLLSGALLFWLEPLKCYNSVSFRIKMALLILVGVNAFFAKPARAKLTGCFSLTLWISIIFAARWIAFF